MRAGYEIVRVKNENSGGVVDNTSSVHECADDIYRMAFFDGGGDPVVSEVKCAGCVCLFFSEVESDLKSRFSIARICCLFN